MTQHKKVTQKQTKIGPNANANGSLTISLTFTERKIENKTTLWAQFKDHTRNVKQCFKMIRNFSMQTRVS